ncbi:MAG: dockerin type I domain-containing protein [Phycisphaerae bacterium]|jgi:hypothetical protein
MILRVTSVVALAVALWLSPPAQAECPLDHFFLYQQDGQLQIEKSRVYRHGDPIEGFYPLAWSNIYQRWSVGEPGFADTTDPAYGFPPEIQLVGEPNVDYQIWFEILDLSPNLRVQMNDGTWLDAIGQQYNLSNWPEHHVHMKYCAYVPGSPAPDYPFYITYRLVDDFGLYDATPPFSLVFNVPTPTVEATDPPYRGVLPSRTDAVISFTFHRPIAVVDGPPVTITDEATHSADYYTDYFTYTVSPNGLTLTLSQVAGTLPNETWLEIALTEHTRDAVTDFPAVPFTHFVYPHELAGDCDGDADVDIDDFAAMAACLAGPEQDPASGCDCADTTGDGDVDLADFALLQQAFTGEMP